MYPLDLPLISMAEACEILDHVVAPDVCRCEPNVLYLILFQLHNFMREFSLRCLGTCASAFGGSEWN